MIKWLPKLVYLSDYANWSDYLDDLQKMFLYDFIECDPCFKDKEVKIKSGYINDKNITFWHIISDGENETDRTLNEDRCQRIKWPKAYIDNESKPAIKIWENKRKRRTRVLLYIEEENYLVILEDRKEYYLLWTAYFVLGRRSKERLLNEWKAYKKAKGASK